MRKVYNKCLQIYWLNNACLHIITFPDAKKEHSFCLVEDSAADLLEIQDKVALLLPRSLLLNFLTIHFTVDSLHLMACCTSALVLPLSTMAVVAINMSGHFNINKLSFDLS